MSRIVGLYQQLLKRNLEHFFPEAVLEPAGDRSIIGLATDEPDRPNYRVEDDAIGLGVELEWLQTRYSFTPSCPCPFLRTERNLIRSTLAVMDRRFRALYDPASAELHSSVFEYATEDQIVAEYLGSTDAWRIPAALEMLRGAALSSYENRRVSTGALLLGTAEDPASPGRVNPPGAPRYNARLAAIKSFHRVCDGVETVYVVDRAGDLAWPVEIKRWADAVQGAEPLAIPCPRQFEPHAKATRSGGHVVVVLTPA